MEEITFPYQWTITMERSATLDEEYNQGGTFKNYLKTYLVPEQYTKSDIIKLTIK